MLRVVGLNVKLGVLLLVFIREWGGDYRYYDRELNIYMYIYIYIYPEYGDSSGIVIGINSPLPFKHW